MLSNLMRFLPLSVILGSWCYVSFRCMPAFEILPLGSPLHQFIVVINLNLKTK